MGKRRPAPLEDSTSRWVEVDGIRVHFRDTGAADGAGTTRPPRSDRLPAGSSSGAGGRPVLLMIHGWMGSAYSYRRLLALLAPQARAIAVDLPGSGLSQKPDIRYNLGFFLPFLARFQETLRLGRVVLVGHSFGGCLALHYARRRPEAVERLVLIAPDGLEGEQGRFALLRRSRLLVGLLSALNNRWAVEWMMRRNIYHDRRRITPDQVDSVAVTALTPEGRRAQASMALNLIGRHPVDSFLPALDLPVLLIWGEKDRLLPPRWAGRFLELLAGARLCRIPQSGHLPQLEDPERTADAIRRFLRESALRPEGGEADQ